ncbi:AGAP011205-PA-like protein [Anopheles sinensis]|uniref:AGAP011205-PA-like protein n=1 Tax=Anopheles sinensis TaxID=74873 RepID=A0A084W3J2_ANOSI|nr:AGAP011205-PA-like protein [Anopheles sinensis]
MPEDPEATAKGEYAFDNPAFKTTEGGGGGAAGNSGAGNASAPNKTGSPLDPSWTSKQNTIEKRKTVDDSYVTASTPRLVALRGSDFTGLGVEVYGGLKEGIFVKKVMPQGPAAGLVNTGDRITSITIDFRHIVQEDAMTILSYASPYNVQLELVSGTKPIVPQTQSPKPGHQSLTHPLYRSSSQSDLNTIERNSRKKLFPSEDSPLKMDNRAASPTALNKVLPTVHKENEREPKKHSFKQQMKEMIEEKFQSKHADVDRKGGSTATMATGASGDEPTGKKGHKFGIRVFPPSVNDKLFGKSPTKMQADNENNFNIEKKESDDSKRAEEQSPSPPPVVKKRTKEPKMVPDVVGAGSDEKVVKLAVEGSSEFQRQNSLTSSGIRRDAAGIPQEVPSFMMQAANAARDNRKSAGAALTATTTSDADNKRKGKAPRPPQNESELDESTVTVDTNLSSFDMTEGNGSRVTMTLNGSGGLDMPDSRRMNFSDNFAEEVLNCTIDSINNIEQFNETGPSNSSTPKSGRKQTSSLTESEIMMAGDTRPSGGNHASDIEQEQVLPRGNTIELNSSDITVHQSSPSPTPASSSVEDDEQPPSMDESNRRTASLGDLSKLAEKPHSNGTGSNSNTLERAQSLEITGDSANVTVTNGGDNTQQIDGAKQRKISSEMGQGSLDPKLDAAEGLNSLQRNRLKGASAWGNLEDAYNSGELLNGGMVDEEEDEEEQEKPEDGGTVLKAQVVVVKETEKPMNQAIIVAEAPKKPQMDDREEHVSLTTIGGGVNYGPYAGDEEKKPHQQTVESGGGSLVNHLVKIGGVTTAYDTNIPDDVKVSRYPFGSLERPKSDVLKKLLGQQEELENTPSVFISADGDGESAISKIKIESNHHQQRSFDVGEPISLTLINPGSTEIVSTSPNDKTGEVATSQVVTSSNTNGVSSINISSTEQHAAGGVTLVKPMLNGGGGMSKFSLLADNIVTISTALDGQEELGNESQPSSIIMIDDEKLDFSLQTLDDFDDSMVTPPPPVDFANSEREDDVHHGQRTVTTIEPEVKSATVTNGTGAVEPPQPPQRSSITMNRRGSSGLPAPGAPMTNGGNGVGFVTEITLKTSEPTMAITPPTAAERPHQMNGMSKNSNDENNATVTTLTTTTTSPTGKPPIVSKKPPKPESKPTTPPSRIPVERRMSSEHSFIPRNTEIKFTTATYESSATTGPRTPTTPRPHGAGGIDQLRSTFERSNSKTEIPVLIRRTSIPSISLSPSGSMASSGGSSGSTTGGSMSNLSSISGGSQTKASPSRIPVFNSVGSLAKLGQNGHDGGTNGSRSPPSPAPQTNGTSGYHHTNGLHNNNNNNGLINNKVSVSITSIKNQAKYPSGKF